LTPNNALIDATVPLDQSRTESDVDDEKEVSS
jgi:hypothetical protein